MRDATLHTIASSRTDLKLQFPSALRACSQGLICGVRMADAATLGRLHPVWASYGLPLPEAVPYLVEVQFEEDPDAPAFAYPPCCVLSKSGLDPVHTRLDSSAVQAALARVRGGPKGGARREAWYAACLHCYCTSYLSCNNW